MRPEKLILVVFVSLSSNLFAQGVKVKYYNKTGYDLDSVIISNSFVGILKKDSSTNFINFNYLLFQDGRPYTDGPGVIKGLGKKYCYPCECGTSVKPVTNGTFEFDVLLIKKPDSYSLSLEKHKD